MSKKCSQGELKHPLVHVQQGRLQKKEKKMNVKKKINNKKRKEKSEISKKNDNNINNDNNNNKKIVNVSIASPFLCSLVDVVKPVD